MSTRFKEKEFIQKENPRLTRVQNYINNVEFGTVPFSDKFIRALKLRDLLSPDGMQIPATPLVIKALYYAHKIHAGQTRRDSGMPTLTHPLQVAEIVASVTKDEDVIAAALLHDTVEDSMTGRGDVETKFKRKINDIDREFNEGVGKYVRAVSIVLDKENVSWWMRKQSIIFSVSDMSMGALLIKSADAIANMQSFIIDRERPGMLESDKFRENLNKQLRYYNDLITAFQYRWPGNPLLERVKYTYGVLKHG